MMRRDRDTTIWGSKSVVDSSTSFLFYQKKRIGKEGRIKIGRSRESPTLSATDFSRFRETVGVILGLISKV
jgi:hypothetical protein